MCKKCGCNTCETDSTALMLNESKAPRSILSEGLKHHIDANKPLTDNFYTAGSRDYFDLIAEARSLYSRGILEFTNKRDIELLTETDQGHFGIFEGKKVPLDFPMLNEEVDSYYLDNAKEKLSNAYKILGKEKGQTRRGDKYLQVNYIPKSSPQTQRPEFVKVFYDNDNDLKGLDLPMLNEIEIGDRVKIDKAYGGGKGEVKDKKGSFIVVNGKSYHESDVKLINESDSNYPDFNLNKNIKYQDTSISSGMWRYTGTEQGGKGVYRNLNNDQILGFDRNDFDIFRKNLSSHFDFSESLNENSLDRDKIDILNKILSTLQNSEKGGEDREDDIENLDVSIDQLTGALTGKDPVAVQFDQSKFGRFASLPKDKLKEVIKSLIDEAKFKGKTVDLNKPTRGDSKKFKVYVNSGKKNADGSIKVKKVNFGHGGTSAKKAGQKTMSIRKSNPKARKAFRARHNCDSPGPKTMARYWSCKKW